MYRLPRIVIFSLSLFFLALGACEWEPDGSYQDLVCDFDGCFTCEGAYCEVYYCNEDTQCPSARFCSDDNLCLITETVVTTTSSHSGCGGQSPCGAGETCQPDGRCTSPSSTNEPSPVITGEGATSDPEASIPESTEEIENSASDTGAEAVETGQIEVNDTPAALPEHPDDFCIVNDDCGFTGICLDAGCYFPCDAIGECPPSQVCEAGQCLPTDDPEVMCTFNGECGPSRVCIEGQCYATCSESLDCGDAMTCSGGLCEADTSPVIQCSGSGACTPNEGCFDGKCLAFCDDARPCDSDALCQFGYCHQKVTCTLSDQCGDTLQCLNGNCQ